ncbi:L-fuculose-phosphate aldolase [Desulfurobacterium pacificum]|uniref:L-fuculose-phosphate aldolase n=1 Tax=Desulfurobacterium pacificum TaxID=240166 RepID=A0ABY1NTA0_9BACT|nr:class II aldolase/adducin family protein [Desulfurobacterium pacificum]SMP17641.1 L-fuculose-phosphate aldolase [Desulfurobacterium pacificum]
MKTFIKEKNEMIKTGRIVFEAGLTDTHGGNISIRKGEHIIIKKSGKMLGFLTEDDFVITTLQKNEKLDEGASIELLVHRAIYQNFSEINAIVHAHSPYTVACSLITNTITPMDSEGKLLLHKVPVLSATCVVSSEEVATKIIGLLKLSPIVVVKSHGAFSTGRNLNEALKYLSALENSCKILSIYHSVKGS